MDKPINVMQVTPLDREWMASRTKELWGADCVVSRGVVHRVAELPGFIAWIEGRRVGVATYRFAECNCELVTLDALRPRIGIGTVLVEAVRKAAAGRRLWLVTTNDNLDAMRFYQRRGFVLTTVYPNAIEDSRKLKPQIPRVGNYGISIRDELVFEYVGDTSP